MEIFLITLSVFLLVILAMSIGVLLKRKGIQGSCGGLANVMGKAGCDACGSEGGCRQENQSKT